MTSDHLLRGRLRRQTHRLPRVHGQASRQRHRGHARPELHAPIAAINKYINKKEGKARECACICGEAKGDDICEPAVVFYFSSPKPGPSTRWYLQGPGSRCPILLRQGRVRKGAGGRYDSCGGFLLIFYHTHCVRLHFGEKEQRNNVILESQVCCLMKFFLSYTHSRLSTRFMQATTNLKPGVPSHAAWAGCQAVSWVHRVLRDLLTELPNTWAGACQKGGKETLQVVLALERERERRSCARLQIPLSGCAKRQLSYGYSLLEYACKAPTARKSIISNLI